MLFEIYQVVLGGDGDAYMFRDFEFAKKFGFCKAHYKKVYEGRISDHSILSALNRLYERFNINRPKDFHGHSMSVSDVVVIDGKSWYVDCFGFEPVDGWEE